MLLWADGFDQYTDPTQGTSLSDELDKFYLLNDVGSSAANGVKSNPGRNGNGLFFDTGHFIRTLQLRTTGTSTSKVCIIGFFLTTPATFANNIRVIEIWSQDSVQCSVEIQTDGTVEFRRGTTVSLGTSTYTFTASNDYYVEFKVTMDTSGGIEMKVADITANGDITPTVSEWTISSVNAEAVGGDKQGFSAVELNYWGAGSMIDDWYICDGSGTTNTDFLNNSFVETLNPTAEGANSDFTPQSGSNNALMVDELAPSDGDTTYVEGTTNGDTDTYVVEDTSDTSVSAIKGVLVLADIRVTQAEPRTIRLPVVSGATTSEGSSQNIANDSFTGRYRVIEQDPNTSGTWATTAVDAMEVGIKRQA